MLPGHQCINITWVFLANEANRSGNFELEKELVPEDTVLSRLHQTHVLQQMLCLSRLCSYADQPKSNCVASVVSKRSLAN